MYRHINDRSNLDEVVCIKRDGTRVTLREDLATNMHRRTDIVLFNGTRSGHEYTLHVTADGFAGDLWILDMLTDQEWQEVAGIAHRMRTNALETTFGYKLLV